MSTRFMTNLILVIFGGFMIVATQAFAPGVVGWLAFAIIGVAVVVLEATTPLFRRRGAVQRTLDAVAGAIGIWTIIASLVFSGRTLVWLSFAEACAFVLLSIAGLILNEYLREHVSVSGSASLQEQEQGQGQGPRAIAA